MDNVWPHLDIQEQLHLHFVSVRQCPRPVCGGVSCTALLQALQAGLCLAQRFQHLPGLGRKSLCHPRHNTLQESKGRRFICGEHLSVSRLAIHTSYAGVPSAERLLSLAAALAVVMECRSITSSGTITREICARAWSCSRCAASPRRNAARGARMEAT